MYAFGHSGASKDIITGERDLCTVKKVLRHITDLTARRYEKAGRLAIDTRGMASTTLSYGVCVNDILQRIFLLPALCPPPPGILPVSFSSSCGRHGGQRAAQAWLA